MHLVTGASGANLPEPELLTDYAREDCAHIAPYYQLQFPAAAKRLEPAQVTLATQILAEQIQTQVSAKTFAQNCIAVTKALWNGNSLEPLAERYGYCSTTHAGLIVGHGDRHQAQLGHYAGAMFFMVASGSGVPTGFVI